MLIFLDIETTGLEEEEKIVSLALIALEDGSCYAKYDLVNEGKKIPAKASSIHHITNEMIRGKPKLKESETYKFLQAQNLPTTTLIAHNIKFDLKMLLACGFEFCGEIIDMLRVTKHLIPECENFSLQFLRYELKLYRDEEREALACSMESEIRSHNALSDALVDKLLYNYLLEIASKDEMCELSFKKVLMQKFNFGKYEGRYIEEISICDRGYLEWMLMNILDLDEDLRYSINYYLEENL